MKCVFERGRGEVLIPVDDNALAFVRAIKTGSGVTVDVKRARNIKFHRLFFSLMNLAFDMWEPPKDREYRGMAIQKNFDRFREDVLILAGHYDASYSIDGGVQLRAKSIAFANCDEDEFKAVYSSVLNVVWERIFKQANFRSKDEVENIVNNLLAYG